MRVVVSHELDVSLKPHVYRLVHAEATVGVVPMVDPTGAVLLDDDGQAMTEERTTFSAPVEVVWAAEDPRWWTGKGQSRKRRKHAQVVEEQRAIVSEVLGQQAEADGDAAAVRAAAVTELPGTGEAL